MSPSTLSARSGARWPGRRHAETRRHHGIAGARLERGRADEVADLFRHEDTGVEIGLRQHHQEFLAAITRDPIAVGTDRALHADDELLQHLIARGMTLLVVDELEMVDVAHDDRQRGRHNGGTAPPPAAAAPSNSAGYRRRSTRR